MEQISCLSCHRFSVPVLPKLKTEDPTLPMTNNWALSLHISYFVHNTKLYLHVKQRKRDKYIHWSSDIAYYWWVLLQWPLTFMVWFEIHHKEALFYNSSEHYQQWSARAAFMSILSLTDGLQWCTVLQAIFKKVLLEEWTFVLLQCRLCEGIRQQTMLTESFITIVVEKMPFLAPSKPERGENISFSTRQLCSEEFCRDANIKWHYS